MGLVMSRIYDRLFAREARILMLGLDAAGKTTLLYKLKLDELVTTIPTIGFNVEHVQYRNLDLNVWDVGGQDRIRPLWRHYYRGTDALMYAPARPCAPCAQPLPATHSRALFTNPSPDPFPPCCLHPPSPPSDSFVIDSSDRERLSEARDELHKVLNDSEMEAENPLILVYANKSDLSNALSASAVGDGMRLHSLKHKWFIQPSSAALGTGVYEGLEWLSEQLKQRAPRPRAGG
jgi:ADP-ribosylation factor protein 1